MATRQDYLSFYPLLWLELVSLRDPVVAQIVLPAEVANRHHSLMAGWGRPPQSRGMYLRATGATTWTIPLRVPPGMTLMDMTLLCWGTGSVTFTTSADATGTTLTGQGPADAQQLYELTTAGPIDASEGADSRRALQVVAGESWDFANIDITATVATSTEFGVAEIIYRPVVQQRT